MWDNLILGGLQARWKCLVSLNCGGLALPLRIKQCLVLKKI